MGKKRQRRRMHGIRTEPDGRIYFRCAYCGWSDHFPEKVVTVARIEQWSKFHAKTICAHYDETTKAP